MEDDEYQCAMCNNIYKLSEDRDAVEREYEQMFPGASKEDRDVVCDDCWQIIRPNRMLN